MMFYGALFWTGKLQKCFTISICTGITFSEMILQQLKGYNCTKVNIQLQQASTLVSAFSQV
jgi:hypothetical protein